MRRPKSSKSIGVHRTGGGDSGIIETPREARKQIAPAQGEIVGAPISMAVSAGTVEGRAARHAWRREQAAAPTTLPVVRVAGGNQRDALPQLRHEPSLLDGGGESHPRASVE